MPLSTTSEPGTIEIINTAGCTLVGEVRVSASFTRERWRASSREVVHPSEDRETRRGGILSLAAASGERLSAEGERRIGDSVSLCGARDT